jgi:hypothetical protein
MIQNLLPVDWREVFLGFRFQVSGVRNDEKRRWHLKPGNRHTGRNKYGIFFKAILWAILITPPET